MSRPDPLLPSERLAIIAILVTNQSADLHLEPQQARQCLHDNLLHLLYD